VVPPLDGLTVRELRSAMLAVESELRAGVHEDKDGLEVQTNIEIVPPNIKLNLEGKDIIAERAGDSIGAYPLADPGCAGCP
jgi:hypothetical protein